GANLAQVLDTAGGLEESDHHGRSLVAALDLLSRHESPNVAPGSIFATPPPRSDGADASPVTPLDKGESRLADVLDRSTSVSRFRSLLHRLVGSGTGNPIQTPGAADADQHQPSRQFLSRANAIQAAVWIVARLAEGLEHAHSRGLLHRDLKPANILLAADGTPMLLDFNLAAQHLPDAADRQLGRALVGGTLPYMSPEPLDPFT